MLICSAHRARARPAIAAPAPSDRRTQKPWDDAGWEAQLAKLEAYKHKHGNSSVPQKWAEDPPLGGWVDSQRKAKRALDRGDPRPKITAARVAQLDKLGFAWRPAWKLDSGRDRNPRNEALWEAQVAKLEAHKRKHGGCNVPQKWARDPGLG